MSEAVADRGLANLDIEVVKESTADKSRLLVDYEFTGCGEILVANNACQFCEDAIDVVEKETTWSESTLTDYEHRVFLQAEHRSSNSLSLIGPSLYQLHKRFELVAMAVLQLYMTKNQFLKITGMSVFEVLRYYPGQQFGLHIDAIPGSNPQRVVSALIYLNDDYEGGEIHFPRQNIAYKPRAGTVLLFPSNYVYPHTSTPVISGRKYVGVSWFLS